MASSFPRPPPALRVYSPAELADATAGFHPICCIGEGGFGKVYRAMVHLTPVAVKVLDHEGLQGLREFHNEMQLLAGIEHPNIVRLLGYAATDSTNATQQPSHATASIAQGNVSSSRFSDGRGAASIPPQAQIDLLSDNPMPAKSHASVSVTDSRNSSGAGSAVQSSSSSATALHNGSTDKRGCQALVYELMTRGNLEERLARRGGFEALTWQTRVHIAAQLGGALAFLHSKGIIHRDIKPANVFLDADLNAKLGDIGLAVMDTLHASGPATMRRFRGARELQSSAASQQHGEDAIGTWHYLAPEYMTQGRSTMRTDTYAFGLTLLQLVAGAGRPSGLVAAAQKALEACDLVNQFLDRSAGHWDVRLAEQVVKLALWACMHVPEHRPPMSTLHEQLSSMCRNLPQHS